MTAQIITYMDSTPTDLKYETKDIMKNEADDLETDDFEEGTRIKTKDFPDTCTSQHVDKGKINSKFKEANTQTEAMMILKKTQK